MLGLASMKFFFLMRCVFMYNWPHTLAIRFGKSIQGRQNMQTMRNTLKCNSRVIKVNDGRCCAGSVGGTSGTVVVPHAGISTVIDGGRLGRLLPLAQLLLNSGVTGTSLTEYWMLCNVVRPFTASALWVNVVSHPRLVFEVWPPSDFCFTLWIRQAPEKCSKQAPVPRCFWSS